jgi:dihydrofolate synthase/folylpolyglutamate synthase
MTYEQAISFWFGRVNYEQRPAKPSDLKLDRMRALLELLGNPQDRLRIIHVAGSKGKGSTSAMLANILRLAGHRTGLFTSPHLCRVEERIQVDGTPISAEDLAALMQDVRRAVLALETTPMAGATPVTFFEMATALGFLHFARQGVETAVVEVGLGGRFDSTNVCQPLVAVITSISIDHTQQLGNTLARIAMEKAGIIKPGCPTVSGVRAKEPEEVIERTCRERGSLLRQLGADFHYHYEPGRITGGEPHRSRVQVVTGQRSWPTMEVALLGEHQAANAAVAVTTVEELRDRGVSIPEAAVVRGLASVRWPARLEVVGRRPLVIVDCAHNLASAEALVATLRTSVPLASTPRRHLIFAGSSDKDLSGMLRVLAPAFTDLYLTRYSNNPRGVPPKRLAALVRRMAGVSWTVWPLASDAWEAARAAAGSDDLICITGSLFLAGELWPLVTGGRPDSSLSPPAGAGEPGDPARNDEPHRAAGCFTDPPAGR